MKNNSNQALWRTAQVLVEDYRAQWGIGPGHFIDRDNWICEEQPLGPGKRLRRIHPDVKACLVKADDFLMSIKRSLCSSI